MKNKIKELQTQFEQIKLEQYRLLKELAKANKTVIIHFKSDGGWTGFEGVISAIENGDLKVVDERYDECVGFNISQFNQLNYDEDNDKIYVIVDLDD